MRAQSLSSWFMWCSLVGFGVILPLAIGQDPQHEFLVQVLRAIGCAGFVLGLIALFRSSGVSPADVGAPGAPAEVPRTLCNNPLGGAISLSERIDMAAEASGMYGRTFGLIYFELHSYEKIARESGVAAADRTVEFVLVMLQMLLRSTDRAESVGKGRFVICLPLLPDGETLHSVRNRAVKAMREIRIEALHGDRLDADTGLAIYPTHGKTGSDLLAHAKRDCLAECEKSRTKTAPGREPAPAFSPRAA